MEKVCRICAAPMVPTERGYKCSFCTYEEVFGEENPYAKPDWDDYTPETDSETDFEEPIREVPMDQVPINIGYAGKSQPDYKKGTKNSTIAKIITIYVVFLVFSSALSMIGMLVNNFMKDKVIKSEPEFVVPTIKEEKSDIDISDSGYLDKLLNGETSFRSVTMPKVVREMFGKPVEEVTKEEFLSIQFFDLEIDYFSRIVRVKYSTEDYSLYPEDYNEEFGDYDEITFGYNDEFEKYITVINIPFEPDMVEDIYADMVCFENAKALRVFEDVYIDLSAFPNLTMLDTCRCDVEELINMNMPVEQIEVLRMSPDDLKGLEQLVNLNNLHIDASIGCIADLSVLSEIHWLENLSLAYTRNPDLDFLENIPNLKNLRILYNRELEDMSGLKRLKNLENLIFE